MVDAPMMIQPVWSFLGRKASGSPPGQLCLLSLHKQRWRVWKKNTSWHVFCGCLSRKFCRCFFKIHMFDTFCCVSEVLFILFCPCNTAQVSIFKRWWSSMHGEGEKRVKEVTMPNWIRFDIWGIIDYWKAKMMWKVVKMFKIWDFFWGFRNDCRNFHSKHGINTGFVGGMPSREVQLGRNCKVPTVLWRCNKSCKRTVATERRRSPASQVSCVRVPGTLGFVFKEISGSIPPGTLNNHNLMVVSIGWFENLYYFTWEVVGNHHFHPFKTGWLSEVFLAFLRLVSDMLNFAACLNPGSQWVDNLFIWREP